MIRIKKGKASIQVPTKNFLKTSYLLYKISDLILLSKVQSSHHIFFGIPLGSLANWCIGSHHFFLPILRIESKGSTLFTYNESGPVKFVSEFQDRKPIYCFYHLEQEKFLDLSFQCQIQ